jgi:hypothetical protein
MNVRKLILKYSKIFIKKRINNEKTLINISFKSSFIKFINYANVPIIYLKHYYKNISKSFNMN